MISQLRLYIYCGTRNEQPYGLDGQYDQYNAYATYSQPTMGNNYLKLNIDPLSEYENLTKTVVSQNIPPIANIQPRYRPNINRSNIFIVKVIFGAIVYVSIMIGSVVMTVVHGINNNNEFISSVSSNLTYIVIANAMKGLTDLLPKEIADVTNFIFVLVSLYIIMHGLINKNPTILIGISTSVVRGVVYTIACFCTGGVLHYFGIASRL